MNSPRSRSLTTQAFWLIAARTLGFVFGLVLPVVLVRVFTETQFGTYKQIFILINTSLVILTFNFSISAYYFLPRRPEKSREIVFNNLLYHAVIGLVALALLTFFPGFLWILSSAETLAPLSRIVGLVICMWIFSSLLEQLATASGDVTWSTTFILGAQLSRTLLLLASAVLFRSVEAVLYAALIQSVLQSLTLLWYVEKRFPGYWRNLDRQMLMEQVRFVIPTGITGVLYAFQADLHNYMVANKFSPAEYAVYAVGTTQVPFIGILRDSINTVMLPRVSKLQQEGNKPEMLRIMLKAWRKTAAILMPAFAVLMILRVEFITVLYSRTYVSASPIFALNLSLLLLSIFLTDAVIRSHTEIRMWMIRIRLISLAIQVAVSLSLMPVFGMIGALMGVTAGFAFERLTNIKVVLRLVGFEWKDFREFRGLAGFAIACVTAAAATVAVLWFMPHQPPALRLVVGGASFGAVYIAMVIGMKLLDEEESEIVNRYSLRFLRMRIV